MALIVCGHGKVVKILTLIVIRFFARSRVSVWVVYDFNDAAFSKALDDQVVSPQNKKAKTYREGTKTAGQKYTSQTNNNASRVSEEKERYKEEVNNIYESFRDRYQFR